MFWLRLFGQEPSSSGSLGHSVEVANLPTIEAFFPSYYFVVVFMLSALFYGMLLSP